MSVFKAYDVRGIYGDEIDEVLAEKIGASFVHLIGGGPIVVGHDMRDCAPSISEAFMRGAQSQGADVIFIGLASTPMTYYAIGSMGCNGGVQITASHNPSQYIGMKFCRASCVPVGYDTGIVEMENACAGDLPAAVATPGTRKDVEIGTGYIDHVASFISTDIKLKCVIDAGNGMAGFELPPVLERMGIDAECLYFELDGTFPNHEANPLKVENMLDVMAAVKKSGADIGLAYDGDADRCAFVDETGTIVANDIMTAIVAKEMLTRHPGAHVVYDLRSSRVVAEEVLKSGGVPIKERVGHSFIKATMRANEAVFGGELSGHYYFKDNFTSDSGVIAMLLVLEIMQRDGKKLSELAAPLLRYPATGEVNFHIEDKDGMIAQLKEVFADGRISDLDGVTVEYDTWWFNVRKSNTEPLLRLNLEADDEATMATCKARLLEMLGDPEE
ncbi:MAG: phosphomannomutase [Planctomycetota bacterium]|jgi:phosphomannomutase